MLLAAAVLTWMIFWMQRQARTMHDDIKRQVSRVNSGDRWALFSLAFLAVVREGIELALFLTAAVFAASAAETLLGALLGLAAAIALGWLVFGSARRIDVRTFFTLSSLLLLVFAAGMVGRGVHELNEAGIIPSIIEHVWSTKSILADTSSMGALLKTLFGYNDDPSLTQVIAYVGYVAVVAWAALARRRQPSPA
jgi:high-affinity iron transporter